MYGHFSPSLQLLLYWHFWYRRSVMKISESIKNYGCALEFI